MAHGLVLFAHGARDPRWAAPFEAVLAAVRTATASPVVLAYLELMQPDLASAIAQLHAEGVRAVHIVPMFLGQGSHLREDLPRRLDALVLQYPEVSFTVAPAAGDDARVREALAAFCLRHLPADST